MKHFLYSVFLLFAVQATAQHKTSTSLTSDTSILDEVIISSVKFPEKKKNIVQKIEVITESNIKKANAQNTGDLLQSTGNVFVQKSQQGGSSPLIRGFEASRILLVVDGVRMNNAIYRSGHLQNAITVDQNMLERVEVMYGPASALHGSDALGGVVSFKTRSPALSGIKNKVLYKGNSLVRYSTANSEETGHADINIGGTKTGLLLSGTFSDFDDMKMGNNYPDKYPNFGRRMQYVSTVNNIDQVLINPDDRRQIFSGYKQWDFLGKFLFKQNEKISHLLNVQLSNSTNVPRYDRLQDMRNGTFRFANWYYGPQKRKLYAYEFNTEFRDSSSFKIVAAFQDIEESRHQRNLNSTSQEHRTEQINVFSANADYRKKTGAHEINIGADIQVNDVTSKANTENIITSAVGKLDTRYPDGINKFNTAGFYAGHLWKLKSGKFVINDGIRVQAVSLHSTLIDTAIQFRLPFTELRQSPFGFAGNIGLVYLAAPSLRFTAGANTGFRAPNIDDVSKIFESNTAARQIIVPNVNLKPEKTINFEVGAVKTFASKFTIDFSAFYTLFNDAIAYAPFLYNGRDTILYNGVNVGVKASQNVAKAKLHGFSNSLTYLPAAGWKVYGSVTYTYGRYTRGTGEKVPLDHIPPVFGKAAVSYNKNKFSAEFFSMYNGWKRIGRYNPDGEDNQQYATPDGVPAWVTLNLRGQYDLIKNITLQLAVENITDRNYRVFASGFSAAGRNFIMSVRASL